MLLTDRQASHPDRLLRNACDGASLKVGSDLTVYVADQSCDFFSAQSLDSDAHDGGLILPGSGEENMEISVQGNANAVLPASSIEYLFVVGAGQP